MKDGSSLLQISNDVVDKMQFLYYVPIRIGTCLPSSCSISDVSVMVKEGENLGNFILYLLSFSSFQSLLLDLSVGAKMFLFGEAVKCESHESFEVKPNMHRKIGG